MNVPFSFTAIVLIVGLCAQNGMAWRRRRRVWYGAHKRQIERQMDTAQSKFSFETTSMELVADYQ